MTRTMIGIKILELTANGLQEIFEMETEPLDDEKRQAEALESLTEMAFAKDSLFLITNLGSVVIRGLEKKTIVFRSVFSRET